MKAKLVNGSEGFEHLWLQIRVNGAKPASFRYGAIGEIQTKKKAVLLYNKEDVVNLVRLALKIFKKFKLKDKYLESIKLK